MAKTSSETPLMQQHNAIKKRYPDAILLFRVGDFYETFYEDAVLCSKVLDIALTSRNKGSPDEIPLAGIPYHALEPYLKKLVAAENPVKPLSDSKMAMILAEQGIKVARRTIAKYREAMSIAPSNERKRLA